MRTNQQKSLNLGGKQTGKISGGMYFAENTLTTDVDGGGEWVRIGYNQPTHPRFALMPIYPTTNPSNVINDYFSINNAVTASQQLNYSGKRLSGILTYSLDARNPTAPAPTDGILFGVRISTISSGGFASIVDQSVRNFSIFAQASTITHTFPIVASSGSSFYIEINNQDALSGTLDVVVINASLSIYE